MQHMERLLRSNIKRFNHSINNKRQTFESNFLLNPLTTPTIDCLVNKDNEIKNNSCCHQKTDINNCSTRAQWRSLLSSAKARNVSLNSNNKNFSRQKDDQNFNENHKSHKKLGISPHVSKPSHHRPHSRTKSTTTQSNSLPFDTGPDTKDFYNEMNIRELVNTVRREIGALIDADQNNSQKQIIISNEKENSTDQSSSKVSSINQNINLSALKKKKKTKTKSHTKHTKKPTIPKVHTQKYRKRKRKLKTRKSHLTPRGKAKIRTKSKKSNVVTSEKHKIKEKQLKPSHSIPLPTTPSNKTLSIEPSNDCCCNFIHYSLRQVMHDAEQIKQFISNTSMIGIDPSKLKDSRNTQYPAICIPMSKCANLSNSEFSHGPTFTTISKSELNQTDDNSKKKTQTNSMIIQTINTQRGPIHIKLDPQSFGLAPFFSNQYETFIKGPPNSIFFNSYMNIFHK